MHAIGIQERYKPRRIASLDLWKISDWRIKVYSILYDGRAMPAPQILNAVRSIVAERLSQVRASQHYGIGYVVVHLARDADFVSLDWWTEENILQQSLFMGPTGEPAELREITATGFLACVWEMEVHNFERLAWISTVLDNPNGPDLSAYLDARCNGYV
jgi:hypothetical protein